MKKNYLPWHWKQNIVNFIFFGLALFLGNVSHPKAQGGYFWSTQAKIPDYYEFTEEPPYLIADLNHTVYAFNSQPLNLEEDASPKAGFYRQWSLESGWTSPNDIFYDPAGGSIDILDVTNDQSGVVFLIYQKNFQEIYFTQAYLANAGSSGAWSDPILIASQSQPVGPGFERVAALTSSVDGNDHVVVYSGSEYGNGLYSVFSSDRGVSWSQSIPVHVSEDLSLIITDPDLYMDSSRVSHGVWASFNSDGSAGPGYYANFDSQTRTWSEAQELDMPGIRTPSVIGYNNIVFISYYHVNVNGNWWKSSSDGGKTWTYPNQISSRHVGTNGKVAFAIDSKNVLHAFFGERIDDNNHGLWHSLWTGVSWTMPEAIVRGPQVKDVIGGNGFDPRSAGVVISNGNIALVAWGTDGAGGVNGAWYSFKVLDAPELQSVPLIVPTLPVITQSDTTNQPISSDVIVSEIGLNDPSNDFDSPPDGYPNPQLPILISVVLALTVIVGVVVVNILSKNRGR